MSNGRLYGTFREARIVRDHLVTCLNLSGTSARDATGKIQINDECRRFVIMTNQIGHEAFYNVAIQTQHVHTYN